MSDSKAGPDTGEGIESSPLGGGCGQLTSQKIEGLAATVFERNAICHNWLLNDVNKLLSFSLCVVIFPWI